MSSRYNPMNKAVPPAGLLRPGEGAEPQLAFQGPAWSKLCSYLKQISVLPAGSGELSGELTKTVGELKSLAERFGSPRKLRELVRANPDALASRDAPGPGYVGLVWLVQSLHTRAETLAGGLSMLEGTGSAQAVVQFLQTLAERAAAAMSLAEPLRSEVSEFKAALLSANAAVGVEIRKSASVLQELQVEVGRHQQEARSAQEAIDKASLLTSKKKKDELKQQLERAKTALNETSAREEKLRGLLAALESAADAGNWLEPALSGLSEFLEVHGKTWMSVSRELTELVANASAEQLADVRWVSHTLGTDEARRKWAAISQAAKAFTASALVDW
jgi:hypothetical protein